MFEDALLQAESNQVRFALILNLQIYLFFFTILKKNFSFKMAISKIKARQQNISSLYI